MCTCCSEEVQRAEQGMELRVTQESLYTKCAVAVGGSDQTRSTTHTTSLPYCLLLFLGLTILGSKF